MLPESETIEFESRSYLNPQTGLDEANSFIENYQALQQQHNAEIRQDTSNLGTDVPSNLGGLTGSEGYFSSRYQTPQTVSAINDLRAVTQASALSQALQNQQAAWKQRYQNAYRAASRRARQASKKTTATQQERKGDIDYQDTGGGRLSLDEESLKESEKRQQEFNKAVSNAESEAHNAAVNRMLRDGTTYAWGTTLLDHINAGKPKVVSLGESM